MNSSGLRRERRSGSHDSMYMPALVELDLVLADRPAVGRRDLGAGEDLLRRRIGHRQVHHS